MDKATEMYKEIIDELANMSKDCADARGVKKGKLPGTDAEQMGMNDILKKLNQPDKLSLLKRNMDVLKKGYPDLGEIVF